MLSCGVKGVALKVLTSRVWSLSNDCLRHDPAKVSILSPEEPIRAPIKELVCSFSLNIYINSKSNDCITTAAADTALKL